MGRHTGTFFLFISWDWLGTASTRLIADGSLLVMPLAVVTAVMWVYGVKMCDNKRVVPIAIISAVLGTWLGLNFP